MKISGSAACSIFVCYLLIVATGCYVPRYVYSPSAQNVPLLAEKGDSKIGLMYSTNGGGITTENQKEYRKFGRGIDIHTAYAINKKFALQANFYQRTEQNGGDFGFQGSGYSIIKYHRHLAEMGFGYYTRLEPASKLWFQGFAGIGFGKFSFNDKGEDDAAVPYTRYHKSGITKIFFQPAIMFQNEKRSAVSLASRFSIINYHNIKTDYSAAELEDYQLAVLGKSPAVFWEPGFIHSFGLKKMPFVRLEYQLGFSILMSSRFYDARSLIFSAGLQADLHNLLKKKPAKPKKD